MLDGSTKTFKDFEGELLVINFWYINCGPCIAEMPYLNDLVETYKDEKIKFLALSFDSIPDITNNNGMIFLFVVFVILSSSIFLN